MVVISAAITTRSGKALLSRQFIDISRVRIEGILSAFPKLMSKDKQHTFIETENVRYVYQPMESLYIVLITNKASNIMEDLDTLHLLTKIVPEYCTLDEASVKRNAFEIIFAFDEVIAAGHKEKVTLNQVKTFTKMDSTDERIFEQTAQIKQREINEYAKRKQLEIESYKRNNIATTGFGSDSMQNYTPGSGGGYSSGMSKSNSNSSYKSSSNKPKETKRTVKGMKLGSSSTPTNEYIKAMEEEGAIQKESNQVNTSNQSQSAPEEVTKEIDIQITEQVTCIANHDGGIEQFEVRGSLDLLLDQNKDGCVMMKLDNTSEHNFIIKTHPNINKTRYNKTGVIALKNTSKSFSPGNTPIMKWKFQSSEEEHIPLNVTCWPSPNRDLTLVNMSYELNSTQLSLLDVVIEIPIPDGHSPVVDNTTEGITEYNHKKRVLFWKHELIDSDNPNGEMEFTIPFSGDDELFFPCVVTFHSKNAFSTFKVLDIVNASTKEKQDFSQTIRLETDNYQIV